MGANREDAREEKRVSGPAIFFRVVLFFLIVPTLVVVIVKLLVG